jgi:hypothetical protein
VEPRGCVNRILAPDSWGEDFLLEKVGMYKQIRVDINQYESEAQRDNADVFVQTGDDFWWHTSFVTVQYLQRQMYLSGDIARESYRMTPVRFVAIETPHVIVENLRQETIEDTIDNLITLGVFESVFMPYPQDEMLPIAAV